MMRAGRLPCCPSTRTAGLESGYLLRRYPSWDACQVGDLAPNDVDVTPKVIELIREGERNAYAADSILNAFQLGLPLIQLVVVRNGVK